jgi:methoxymalonate biosynthesis acyl carrier protein
MNDQDAVLAVIASIFDEELGLTVPSPDEDLFKSGVMDSLSFVNMLTQLEGRFGIVVSLEELEMDNFRSLREIAEFVTQRGDRSTDSVTSISQEKNRTSA